MTSDSTQSLAHQLAHHTGTTQIYRHPLSSLLYTDGVKDLAEISGAYWLIDLVASYLPRMRQDPDIWAFSLWGITLTGGGGCSCSVTCRVDTDAEPYIQQDIGYTDFPEDYEWYVVDGTMMLKSEY